MRWNFGSSSGRLLSHGSAAVALAFAGVLFAMPLAHVEQRLQAAKSEGCEGGGFRIVLANGTTLSGAVDSSVAAASLGTRFQVRGRYVEFDVVAATFEVLNYAFTGAPNPLDMTGGVRTPVYERKTPNHRGLVLNGRLNVELGEENLEIDRSGPGLTMKIQAKDCAAGGVFQMEVERGDATTTDITHVLASPASGEPAFMTAFYFDNPNFRAREGDIVPYKDTTLPVPSRINIANDFSRKFIGRDSPQVAQRVPQGCPNNILKRDGTTTVVDHCGGVSVWRVSSGGRMGAVFGEDAHEVAPPATICTHQCQAQNRVRGQSVKLGFPFPVPDSSRLKPRFPATP